MVKKLAAVAASMAIVTLCASPAHAANYSLSVSNPYTGWAGGAGHLDGSLTFTGQHRFEYAFFIRDACGSSGQGDGLGVYMNFNVWRNNGFFVQTEVKGTDTNGCGPLAQSFGGDIVRPNILVAGAIAQVWLGDNGERVTDIVDSSLKKNPYVP